MKPACVKARVARKSRGQKCPYGFDSRPEHEGQFLKIAPFYKSLIISTFAFIRLYFMLFGFARLRTELHSGDD